MRVDNATNIREGFIKLYVRCCIGRRSEFSFNDITVEVAVLTAYMPEDWAEEAMAVVDDVVREPVPLIDQLEGVDTQRQREILQEYSARQIAALDHVVGTIRGLNETE